MKKPTLILFLTTLLAALPFGALAFQPRAAQSSAACGDLFFSEYIEGSSNNKAIEIYNGTGAPVDLSAYTIARYANGSETPATLALSGTLADGDVFIAAHASANAAILAAADVTNSSVISFNGNDAVELQKNGTTVDVFGRIGEDPGSAWSGGGVSTVNSTLVRKLTIIAGDADGTDAFDPSLEWDAYPSDDTANLGFHVGSCDSGNATAIYDIQFTTDPLGDSPLEGQVVTTTATVYGVYPEGFAMADAAGAWNGIYVSTEGAPTVAVGDIVQVVATVDEDMGRTTLGRTGTPITVTTLSTGGTPHAPTLIATGNVTESVEGVFVTTDSVTVSNINPDDPNDEGEFLITDSTSDLRASDLNGTAYEPTLNESLSFVRGMMDFEANNFKIAYRNLGDIGIIGGGDCGSAATLISTIQGAGSASPLDGTDVTIEGVVVGEFLGTDSLRGFYIQEEDADADADANTSEGIFVFYTGTVEVNVGDVVRVSGTVDEYFDLTELTSVSDVLLCDTGNSVTPASVTLPYSSLDNFEKVEGMLVTFPQTMYVTEHYNLGRYGQLSISAEDRLYNPTQVTTPGAAAVAYQAANDRQRILLDDTTNAQNPTVVPHLGPDNTVRGGDSLENLTAVMDYSFEEYKLRPVAPIIFDRTNPRPSSAPDAGAFLSVASFNVLNYFVTLDGNGAICGPTGGQDCRGADNALEFDRQRTKIINALVQLDSDVVGLIEIENHANDDAVSDLIDGLNDVLGAGTYASIQTGTIGDDAIKVALIYKPATVTPVGNYAILDQSVDASYIDSKNRPALAQTFQENATAETFTAVVNHLKSKGSDCNDLGDPDTGDGQGNCNLTRTAAASAEINWLASDPTDRNETDILVLGDLNAYAMEDPITTFEDGGYSDLLELFEGETRYSYVFDGQWGTLDYAMASSTMLPQVQNAAAYNINADEPRLLDYNTEFNPLNLYQPNEFRASDHDAIVVHLSLGSPAVLAITKTVATDGEVMVGDTVTYTVQVGNSGTGTASSVQIVDIMPDYMISAGLNETITLTGGAVQEFAYSATVGNSAPTGVTQVTNVVTAILGTTSVSDSATFELTHPDIALAITKTVETVGVVTVGDTVTYTVVLRNTGADAAVDVSIVDVMPDYLESAGLNLTATVNGNDALTYVYTATVGSTAPTGITQVVNSVTATYDTISVSDSATFELRYFRILLPIVRN